MIKHLAMYIVGTAWTGISAMLAYGYVRHGVMDSQLTTVWFGMLTAGLYKVGLADGLPLVNGAAAKAAMQKQINEAAATEPPPPD